jgi:hypothetical protein
MRRVPAALLRRSALIRHLALAICLTTIIAASTTAQAVPFPVEEFDAHDRIARALLAYDACAWRSTDELMKQPRAARADVGRVWFCLPHGDDWDAIYGRSEPAADRYEIRFHFRVSRAGVTLSTEPLDTARVHAAARALSATLGDAPAAVTASGIRFNPYVQFAGDSMVTVWLLPAWQPNGLAAFGAQVRDDYGGDGRRRERRAVVEGPILLARPDTSESFRIDSNSGDVATVGDLFFMYLLRPYFAGIRIQTGRFSSQLVKAGDGYAWVHAVRTPPSSPPARPEN